LVTPGIFFPAGKHPIEGRVVCPDCSARLTVAERKPVPLKLRAFLDFAAPQLRERIVQVGAT